MSNTETLQDIIAEMRAKASWETDYYEALRLDEWAGRLTAIADRYEDDHK